MTIFQSAVDRFRIRNEPLWTYRGDEVRFEQLSKYRQRVAPALLRAFQERKVAVYFSNSLMLAKTLAVIQGISHEVLLIPRDTEWKLIKDYMRRSGTGLIITDTEINEQDGIETINVLKLEMEHNAVDPPTGTTETKWIIPTSGTTNVPKLVVHSLIGLLRTTKQDPEKGKLMRWGLLYDVSRFAGLQVYLQSLLGGSTLILTDNSSGLDEQISEFADSRINALSATPTMWRKMLMSSVFPRMELKQITLGGEIVDQPILKALRRQFPAARLTHIYASTEAGVGFSVNDGKAGFPALFVDRTPNGVRIRVDGEGMMFLKPPTSEGSRYVGASDRLVQEDGFIQTGDLVEKSGERYYFLGRANGAINVGGNKVIPEEVEQVILKYPGINFVKVRPKKSPITGELVTAEVVLQHPVLDRRQFESDLSTFCGQFLNRYKVPALIEISDSVQIDRSGKMRRNAR